MTYKEVYDIAVPLKKRQEEKWNILANNIFRPISVLLTVPLVNTKIKPITITAISIVSAILGFVLVSSSLSVWLSILGWFFFFAWDILDGVDGNLARCTNQCSPLGDLWDTTGGYAAMVLIYFSVGIAAAFDNNTFEFASPIMMSIFGGATAIMSIFPRLVMHKKKSSGIESDVIKEMTNKQDFSISKIFALNFISPTGFMQIFLLICIITHTLNIFISFYFIVNFAIMILSLRKLLKA
jgi:phosphatidylglycerophosphate synthase